MKILKITLIVIASLGLIGAAGYLYASSGVKSKPGYVKLIKPRGESINAMLSINLGPNGVAPVRWFLEQITEDSDYQHEIPERMLKSALHELQGVQLRIYEVHNNREAFNTAIAESVAALKKKNWQTLMTVREDDEHIAVMQFGDDQQILGLSIMASTPDNALFLNLIGPFDPQAIAETAKQLN